jgi:hypothetical protein
MPDSNVAIEKLQRIQELWVELRRTKVDAPEYRQVIDKIRVLSDEYRALVDAIKG